MQSAHEAQHYALQLKIACVPYQAVPMTVLFELIVFGNVVILVDRLKFDQHDFIQPPGPQPQYSSGLSRGTELAGSGTLRRDLC